MTKASTDEGWERIGSIIPELYQIVSELVGNGNETYFERNSVTTNCDAPIVPVLRAVPTGVNGHICRVNWILKIVPSHLESARIIGLIDRDGETVFLGRADDRYITRECA